MTDLTLLLFNIFLSIVFVFASILTILFSLVYIFNTLIPILFSSIREKLKLAQAIEDGLLDKPQDNN